MSMDRLVELFLQSSRGDDASGPVGELDEEGIERAVENTEKMLTGQDAAAMVGSPDATFVCLGMALEEKPKLAPAAIGCYEKALQYHSSGAKSRGWERCVVLQQLGAVCLRIKRLQAADKWFTQCSEVCLQADGHPRDAVLFNGSFSTQQTRLEFAEMVEKLHAKTCHELGDMERAHKHVNEAKRLQAAATGDAVERQASGLGRAASSPAASKVSSDPVKELWAAEPAEEVNLKSYHFMDEGPTVLVMLDLNEHLGIGEEASAAVDSLRQFRVKCEETSVDIQLRLRRKDGRVVHFRLLLSPIQKDIVPEDTVPKLRGKESKRRLEIKLFKREKKDTWYGDLVKGEVAKTTKKPEPPSAPKGSLLNPLTAEELAALPKPSDSRGDNRPSSFGGRGAASNGDAPSHFLEGKTQPRWVEKVQQRQEALDLLLLEIQISDAFPEVSMKDLDLGTDGEMFSLTLQSDAGSPLSVPLPSGADMGNMEARWRRKTRTLEIRIPTLD
eukprot:CAMPEP_0197655602 /NCGR_PEP_ID=MMETSP1338-20131121/39553_1 /TAXON_ID=43686 ORGANISM="Pelagodinium beii, Strain RCC1491" /NCGR_SAMPLE_ID=MMETSP1338 /ASSEMBLY_ACC=CAM_ASM_000754 /LENGTH=499 /DNA_ID=CAMNT_0043231279 /DNA_START=38 /DNA_END=1537 /DNA_ORIENTATION=-